tara:strand:- start:1530 stop:2693 length:1164 start_codon:yes stop_codon:yes gene_type:complete
MKKIAKICVFTGGRAEYGILKPLLDELKKDKNFSLKLLVSGMHLSNEFGLTYKTIETDGFKCDEKIEMVMSSDTTEGICKSIGIGIISYGEALKRIAPDWLVILGDRYESMALAVAATVSRIPIAHIQGGEVTTGAIDDHFRHSITKMSNLHFVYADEYKKRVVQLGENPKSVFNYGALNLDAIKKIKVLEKNQLFEQLNLDITQKVAIVTFHPVTLDNNSSLKQFQELLNALKKFDDLQIVFTKTNSDTDGRVINSMIDKYVLANKKSSSCFKSLGQLKYISLLKYSKIVIGNSSSGLIETPIFKIPTVNIGDREKGRIRTKNIIDCDPSTKNIVSAIKKGLSKKFINSLVKMKNPLEKRDTAKKIANKLKYFPKVKSTKKDFYNI